MSRITEAARGEACQIRIPGICNHNPETSVWCHANGSAAGKGIGMKSPDILGAIGCSDCHNLYDRRTQQNVFSREQIELYFWQGHARSVCVLIAKGAISQVSGKLEVA